MRNYSPAPQPLLCQLHMIPGQAELVVQLVGKWVVMRSSSSSPLTIRISNWSNRQTRSSLAPNAVAETQTLIRLADSEDREVTRSYQPHSNGRGPRHPERI
jgi:hypothetical protein